MKGIIITLACIASFLGFCAAANAYDGSRVTHTYTVGAEFLTGQPAVWEHKTGRLGMENSEKLVGYYGGGHPRVIGFGCEGAHAPMIAMEEDDLPRCKRVEGITYKAPDLETAY